MAIPLNFHISRNKGDYYAGPNVKTIDRPSHKLYHLSRKWYGIYMQKHSKLARGTAVPLGMVGVAVIPIGVITDIVYNLSISTFSGLAHVCTGKRFRFLGKLSKRNFRMLGADCISFGGMFITVPADMVNLCIAPMIDPKKFGKNMEFNNSKGPPHGHVYEW